eukprot:6541311-Prymnesium_polylepis.1
MAGAGGTSDRAQRERARRCSLGTAARSPGRCVEQQTLGLWRRRPRRPCSGGTDSMWCWWRRRRRVHILVLYALFVGQEIFCVAHLAVVKANDREQEECNPRTCKESLARRLNCWQLAGCRAGHAEELRTEI